jgi:hypothetical protein
MISKIIPVLPMLNTKETIKFYEYYFGFTVIDQGGYLLMQKDDIQLHFFLCTDEYLCRNSRCYIVVKNIEDLYSDCCALDIIYLKDRLKNTSGGNKEFCIYDNNGNTLRFAEETQ